ncbi:MAG: hypothetical protein PHC94_03285, partial [Methylobacter sp.]|nr:hypothetical protein [Methylobacter sp.]
MIVIKLSLVMFAIWKNCVNSVVQSQSFSLCFTLPVGNPALPPYLSKYWARAIFKTALEQRYRSVSTPAENDCSAAPQTP